jgi:cephalosporin hydroxylase
MSTMRSLMRRARRVMHGRAADDERSTIDAFHRLYYERGGGGTTWCDTWWFGVRVFKSPLDLWIYQEILNDTRPDLVIETGTAFGGSALFLATMFDMIGHGEVITVDVTPRARPTHDRIRYLEGSSVDSQVLAEVAATARDRRRVMVVLDSDHARDHVLRELERYAPFVTEGCYLIVEDTNVNGHPVHRGFGPGPHEAVEEFLTHHDEFERDRRREKFLVTFNPGGYLRRT